MALEAKLTKETTGEKEEDVFIIKFTNGTLKQLRELGDFLEKDGFPISDPDDEVSKLKDVVRVGIAWLERLKERKSKDEIDKA